MGRTIHLCLFDPSQSSEERFREPFEGLSDVTIVGDFQTWEDLQTALCSGVVEVLAINLDGAELDSGLRVAKSATEVSPGCAVVGVSRAQDAQTIIAAMRAGCAQFVPWPVDAADLERAFARIRMMLAPAVVESQRICVVGASGGAGATTVACNLAVALASVTGRACGLVDLHLEFGDVACLFDIYPEHSIADACSPDSQLNPLRLQGLLHELPGNVSVLARPPEAGTAAHISSESIEQTLKLMARMFQYVVVDTPRARQVGTERALVGADRVLIVTQLVMNQLYNALRLYESLRGAGVAEQRLEFVVNRHNSSFQQLTLDELEKQLKKPVYAVIPNDYQGAAMANSLGTPTILSSKQSECRRAVEDLATQIAIANAARNVPSNACAEWLQKLSYRRSREAACTSRDEQVGAPDNGEAVAGACDADTQET